MMMLGGEHLDEDDHQDIFIDDPDEFDEDEDDDEQEQIHIDRLIRHPGGVAVAAAGQRQFDIINPSA